MNLRAWFDQARTDFGRRDDRDRQRLPLAYHEAFQYREIDPDRAIAILSEARDLARRLDEPWWDVFYDSARISALIHFKRDFRNVIDLATRCALEIRKPGFAQFPGRVRVLDALLCAYLGCDAEGYAEAIRDALDQMEREIGDRVCDDRFLFQARRRAIAVEHQQWDEAHGLAMREIDLVGQSRDQPGILDYALFAWCALCQIAYRRKNWAHLADYVAKGEATAARCTHRCEEAELNAWKAVVDRYAGREEKGRAELDRAEATIRSIRMPPKSAFFDALAAYFDLGSHIVEELQVRDRELGILADRQRTLQEFRVRVERCRLLSKLNRPHDEDLERTRESARRLRFPEKHLREVEALLAAAS